jgi:hypothetical protein
MVTVCQHCGHPLPEAEVLLDLTISQRRIYQVVKSAGQAGICRRDIFDAVYRDDPNGGPDSLNVINVQKTKMKRRLAKHGLKIESTMGWDAKWRLEKIG